MRFIILSFILLLISVDSIFSQTKHFSGTWTKENTSYQFDFELTLHIDKSNMIDGFFEWTVIQYDVNNILSKEHYKKKLNKTAKEYVKGKYFPSRREIILKGYKKDDPHNIIGIDIYRIKIDENGDLGGTTNANGSWLGRINGKPVDMEVL